MKRTINILFRVYSNVPYAFFVVFLLVVIISALLNGSLIINNATFDLLLLKALALACVAGIFVFPPVAIAVLVCNRHKWKNLLSPVLAYSLYLVAVIFAGHMGWWVD